MKHTKTTLEVACNYLNWQGGTIHQVWDEYNKMTENKRNNFVSHLVKQVSDISDARTVLEFTRNRMKKGF